MKRLWKSRIIVKFFLSYLGILILLSVFFYLYSGTVVKDFYISFLSGKMEREARLLDRLLPLNLEGDAFDRSLRDLARDLGVRLTVIDLDGKVLGDSDESSAMMENHRGRPEVVEALSKGEGKSIRYSTTVKSELLYRAVLHREEQRIIRLSVPLGVIEEALRSLRNAMLLGLLLVSGIGVGLAFLFSRHLGGRVARMAELSQEVARGSLSQASLLVKEDDELGILEKNLNEMSRSLREKIKAIVAEKEKVESILKCMTEGVLAVDTHGRIIVLNENARRMFNLLPTQSFHGASFMEISRHPEMKRLMEEVLTCDCSAECFTKEVSLGEGNWFRVNAVSLRGENEKALGFIMVFHDVTELKRLETVRADFVANVSHELRTPLTAIRGYAETLLRSPPADPKDAEQFLSIIYRHSERLGRLIDDLLALSDLESGKIQIGRERLQATELVGRVLEIFQDQARRKEIALSHKIDPGLPPILGDSDRLQQLLINLVDNALKYTDKGAITVSARLLEDNRREATGERQQESEKLTTASRLMPHASPRWVEITVTDTGCGIPEKDLPRLTERFYRVDRARSRELGGTGLGLAIVKHLVQAHGGELRIESELGKGTTVRFTLPVA